MRAGEIPGTGYLERILFNQDMQKLRRESLLVDLRQRIRDVRMGTDELLYVLTDEQTRKTYLRHGTPPDSVYGVKVGNRKPIAKKIRGQQQLGLDLYATGNRDAMYLAGLIVDGSRMIRKQLDGWISNSGGAAGISEGTVIWVAAEHPDAVAIANKWMKSKDLTTAVARKIGQVEVDMGDTSCKTPLATGCIDKIEQMGRIGRKRKTLRG